MDGAGYSGSDALRKRRAALIQEEVEGKIINLAITSSKLSMKSLISGLRVFIEYEKRKNSGVEDLRVKGKQTVKQLVGQNQGVTSIPVTDGRIRELDRIAKKYGVDYAILKNDQREESKYTIFFKARDADVLEEIIKDYTDRSVSRKKAAVSELKREKKKVPEKIPVIKPEIKERSR